MPLRFLTLGQVAVQRGEQLRPWPPQPSRSLFLYLLGHPEGASVLRILAELWALEDTPVHRNRLRVVVYRLRRRFGREAVERWSGGYRLSGKLIQATDLWAFYQAIERGERTQGEERIVAYEEARTLYRGVFAPGEEGEWVEELRNNIQEACARANLGLAQTALQLGKLRLASEALEAALGLDPYLSEEYQQELLALLARTEGKYAALEHYRRYAEFLRRELNDEPLPETQAIARKIAHGELPPCPILQQEPHSYHCPLSPDGSCAWLRRFQSSGA